MNKPEYPCECPCRHCEDRFAGCHSVCNKYMGWREQLNKWNAYEHERIRIKCLGISRKRRKTRT